ncbi:MAG: hypothetical protein ACOX5W_06200 [Bacillota bacterium]|jgi:hypothetical protein
MILNKKISLVLLAAFCIIMILPLYGFGSTEIDDAKDDIIIKENLVEVKPDGIFIQAGTKQTEIAQQLHGEKISYGEFVRRVFPEAVNYIKPEHMQDMDSKPFPWEDKDNSQLEQNVTNLSYPNWIYFVSNIGGTAREIGYSATQQLVFPTALCSYMSTTATVEKDNNGTITQETYAYSYSADCVMDVASGIYNGGPGVYRSVGYYLYGSPPGYSPPSGTYTTYTSWKNMN